MNDYSVTGTIGEAFAEALIGRKAKKPSPSMVEVAAIEHSTYPLRLVDISEACDILHCSRSLLYRLIGAHEIVPIKLGRLTKIPLVSLDAFISSKIKASLVGQ